MHHKFAFSSQYESSDSSKKLLSPVPRLNQVLITIHRFDSKLLSPRKRDARSPDYGLAIQKYLTTEYADFGIDTRNIVGLKSIESEWSSEGSDAQVNRAIDLLKRLIEFNALHPKLANKATRIERSNEALNEQLFLTKCQLSCLSIEKFLSPETSIPSSLSRNGWLPYRARSRNNLT